MPDDAAIGEEPSRERLIRREGGNPEVDGDAGEASISGAPVWEGWGLWWKRMKRRALWRQAVSMWSE